MLSIIVLILLVTFICINRFKEESVCKTTLKVMSKEDYWKISPYNPIDKTSFQNSLFSKKKKYKENYFKMQALYKKGVDAFLDKELQLEEIDKKLLKNKFGVTQWNEKDLYKKYNTLNTEYIYLRNYAHIERLTDKQIEFLYDRIVDCNESLDKDLNNLIEKTFEEVLAYNFDAGQIELAKDSADSTSPYISIKKKSLVFMISYDILNDHDYEIYRSNIPLIKDYENRFTWNKSMDIEVVILYQGEVALNGKKK